MITMNRLYTAKCIDGKEIRLCQHPNGNYHILTGFPGGYFRTETICDYFADAYREYNARIVRT